MNILIQPWNRSLTKLITVRIVELVSNARASVDVRQRQNKTAFSASFNVEQKYLNSIVVEEENIWKEKRTTQNVLVSIDLSRCNADAGS